MQKHIKKFKVVFLLFLIFALFASSSMPIPKVGGSEVKILDVDFEQINLSNPQRISGNDKQQGAVYLYNNIITIDGIEIYAKIKIEEINNATLVEFDYENTNINPPQNPPRFEPTIRTGNGGGYVNFNISFFEEGTDEPVYLHGFALTGVDVDSSGGSTRIEYQEISGFASYILDAGTELLHSLQPNGYTRFTGTPKVLPGVTFDDTASYIAYYMVPITSLNIKMGNLNQQTSARQNSVNLGNVIGAFTNAVEYPNQDMPAIDVTIDDVAGILDNRVVDLENVGLFGNTDAGFGRVVNLSVTDGVNTVTGSTTVQSDGTYSLDMNLASLMPGAITATASVSNSAGNPASATDTSEIVKCYTVEYIDYDNSSWDTQEDISHGDTVTALPANPSRDNYTFTGWNTNADGSGTAFDETTLVTDNITVYAQYTINSYNVKFVDHDGNEIKSESVEHGGGATAPSDPTRPGYTFTGWDEEFDNVTGDLVVTAQYSKNSYTVTYDKNGGDTGAAPGNQTVDYNDTVGTLPTSPTKDGYIFTGWNANADGSGTAFDETTLVTDNITVYAQYTINSYNVKFVDHDGNELKSESVEHGGGATAPSDPTRPGYTFTGWDEDFDNVTGDLVVTAQYSKNSYTVTYDKNGGDTGAAPGNQTVDYN
ncbi:MAG: InlB B-repeat-containing protein, partial [Firmicutes bacterium]|nr:InlB B-repeat-containing protein [Bacillota bacterium]